MNDRAIDALVLAMKGINDRLTARIEALEARALIPGRDGRDGAPGPMGERGLMGDRGLPGEPGPQGVQGERGPAGEVGPQGPSGPPGAPGPPGPAGERGSAGEVGPQGPTGERGATGERGLDGVAGLQGPSGLPGRDGRDGLVGERGADGVNGRDGLSFDALEATLDVPTKTIHLRCESGAYSKAWRWFVPMVVYKGVYAPDTTYLEGDSVTWAGSQWVARTTTTERPDETGEGARAWQLSAKRGRDGKAGKDGAVGPEGKAGPAGRDLTQIGFDGKKW